MNGGRKTLRKKYVKKYFLGKNMSKTKTKKL
jgi:hypothetical protein